MFCQKCGSQIEEGALFCRNCGARAAALETVTGGEDFGSFKEFVDNHVQAVTKYRSAEDLINNSRPMRFAWIYIGILSLLGCILGAVNIGGFPGLLGGLLIFGGFFGYAAVFIASGMIRMSYKAKFAGESEQNVNTDEFLQFLEKHLKTLSPYFHNCGYLSRRGLTTIAENAISKAYREVRICCACGPKGKNLAIIGIRPDEKAPDSGRIRYSVDAIRGGFLIDGRAAGFLGHSCLIKTAPVLQAAMMYYIKNQQ